jgi:hypothetical protein
MVGTQPALWKECNGKRHGALPVGGKRFVVSLGWRNRPDSVSLALPTTLVAGAAIALRTAKHTTSNAR